MTHQAPQLEAAAGCDAARQLAQLRQVLLLVERIAGRADGRRTAEAVLDEGALVGAAFGDALPIVQRRFDALVAETVAWAASGVEALAKAGGGSAAAARLGEELSRAIEDLLKLLKL